MPELARKPNPPPVRKPPPPPGVVLVEVRCWHCRRIVTEAEPGRWIRCLHKCGQWVNEAAPSVDAAA